MIVVMDFGVEAQALGGGEGFHALCAFVWLFATMQPYMGIQIAREAKTAFADVALVRHVAIMDAFMLAIASHLGEFQTTYLAFEHLGLVMRPLVGFEIRQVSIFLIAFVASIRPFAGMQINVAFKHVMSNESLFTLIAFERSFPRMDAIVDLQITRTSETTATSLAFVLLLVRMH